MDHPCTIAIPTPLGPLAITATGSHVTAVRFDAEDPSTAIDHAPELLLIAQQQFEEYFAGTRQLFNLPLSQPGTAFQQLVWRELQSIPFGETRSYSWLAARIGNPVAMRAVGMANGRNNLAIIVPCHRVIGADGSLVGYGGGLERKRWLIEHEAAAAGVKLPAGRASVYT